MTTVGEQFARALAAKDLGRVAELVHPEVDFRDSTTDGRIGWMRVICPGVRPATPG